MNDSNESWVYTITNVSGNSFPVSEITEMEHHFSPTRSWWIAYVPNHFHILDEEWGQTAMDLLNWPKEEPE